VLLEVVFRFLGLLGLYCCDKILWSLGSDIGIGDIIDLVGIEPLYSLDILLGNIQSFILEVR